MPNPPVLEPCPFCGAEMRVGAHSAFHPAAEPGVLWCWLSTAGEFGTVLELAEEDYPAWNRRRVTVTVPEAAGVLGLGISAAYRAADSGRLPTIRVGRKMLVPVAALKKLLAGGEGSDG